MGLTKTEAQVEIAMLEVLDNQPKGTAGWDDFDFNVNNLRINPSTSKPDFDYMEGEFLFDPDTTETVVGNKITKHAYKVGAVFWKPHIHWAQSNSGNVVWQLEYKMWAANTNEPAAYTTITTILKEFTYTSGILHQISPFADVSMAAYNSVAIHVKVRVSRLGADVADTYSGDVRFLGFDFHVPIDQPTGSRDVYTK